MLVNTAKYCESIQDVIWSLTEMMTKPTQPLIIILLQNIAKLFKSLFDLWQKSLPNLPNPLSSFCCKILRTYSSRYLISDRTDFQTYPTPYRPSTESDYHFDDVHNTICDTKQASSAWMTGQAIARGMHVQGGRKQGGQGAHGPNRFCQNRKEDSSRKRQSITLPPPPPYFWTFRRSWCATCANKATLQNLTRTIYM